MNTTFSQKLLFCVSLLIIWYIHPILEFKIFRIFYSFDGIAESTQCIPKQSALFIKLSQSCFFINCTYLVRKYFRIYLGSFLGNKKNTPEVVLCCVYGQNFGMWVFACCANALNDVLPKWHKSKNKLTFICHLLPELDHLFKSETALSTRHLGVNSLMRPSIWSQFLSFIMKTFLGGKGISKLTMSYIISYKNKIDSQFNIFKHKQKCLSLTFSLNCLKRNKLYTSQAKGLSNIAFKSLHVFSLNCLKRNTMNSFN